MESIQSELRDAGKALLLLRAEMGQREARMSAVLEEQARMLQHAAERFRSDIAGLVGQAGAEMAQEAKRAVAPVASQYERTVSATTARLEAANKTVWLWFGAIGAVLLLVLVVGWTVLGYYRRELGATKAELGRYENAVPVVQAFYASDAILCDGRICANVGSDSQRFGDERQYRQAKPRPQK